MRESRTFAERTRVSHIDRTLRKYFLVYEGAGTEQIYFEAVNSAREEIGINPLIELISIQRSYSEEGWSNPKKILDRLIKDIEESKTRYISYETLLNRIMDFLQEQHILDAEKSTKSIWEMLVCICKDIIKKPLEDAVEDIEKDCDVVLQILKGELKIEKDMSEISEKIENGGLTYAEGFDKICLIVDRDRNSFLSVPQNDQYSYVLSKCLEKNFGFYVTNPCFEFWLLLHFKEVLNLDFDKLLENPRITSKRRYAEDELKKIYPKYRKTKYNAEFLVKNIDKAIENEKEFCEDIYGLKDAVGSNIGILITEMRNQSIH